MSDIYSFDLFNYPSRVLIRIENNSEHVLLLMYELSAKIEGKKKKYTAEFSFYYFGKIINEAGNLVKALTSRTILINLRLSKISCILTLFTYTCHSNHDPMRTHHAVCSVTFLTLARSPLKQVLAISSWFYLFFSHRKKKAM